MAEDRPRRARVIATIAVLGHLVATLIAIACLRWFAPDSFGVTLAERILWGVWIVHALAQVLTRVTIFGWNFRALFPALLPADEKPPAASPAADQGAVVQVGQGELLHHRDPCVADRSLRPRHRSHVHPQRRGRRLGLLAGVHDHLGVVVAFGHCRRADQDRTLRQGKNKGETGNGNGKARTVPGDTENFGGGFMKVSIIGGGGLVGSSAAYALQCGGIVSHLCLIDANADAAKGHALELLHGSCMSSDQRIVRPERWRTCRAATSW